MYRRLLAPAAILILLVLNVQSLSAGTVPEDCKLTVNGQVVSGDLVDVRPGDVLRLNCTNVLVPSDASGNFSTNMLVDSSLGYWWKTKRSGSDNFSERDRPSFSLQPGNYEVQVNGIVRDTIKVEDGELKDKPAVVNIFTLEIAGQAVATPQLITNAISEDYRNAQVTLERLRSKVGQNPDSSQKVSPLLDRVQDILEDGKPADAISLMQVIEGLFDDTIGLQNDHQEIQGQMEFYRLLFFGAFILIIILLVLGWRRLWSWIPGFFNPPQP